MAHPDSLLSLRRAIAAGSLPVPVSSGSVEASQCDLTAATHLLFSPAAWDEQVPFTIPITAETRFSSSVGGRVDLRSVYLAWMNRELPIPDYIATIQRINEQLAGPGGAGGKIQNLVFVERIDLVNWLGGTAAESEHIRPIGGERMATGGVGASAGASLENGVGSSGLADVDPQLSEIYASERGLVDHNSVLRGAKPMDFSATRQHCRAFFSKSSDPASRLTQSSALLPNRKKTPRVEPIILLSPSASSILRMSNIKQFLESGLFVPADSAAAGSSSSATILHINRLIPSIDPSRPLRFIIVDNPDQFKPEYWDRLVAVFTTGQSWQFKSYKWTEPTELFSKVMGTYVGWSNDKVPETVSSWGRNVKSYELDKWSALQGDKGRWKDKEVVESFWTLLEDHMQQRGWTKSGPRTATR